MLSLSPQSYYWSQESLLINKQFHLWWISRSCRISWSSFLNKNIWLLHFISNICFKEQAFLISDFPIQPGCSRSVMSDSLRPLGLQPARLLHPWDSPGKNTGVGCHALLQGVFLTQGSNQSLLTPPAMSGWFFTTSATWEASPHSIYC